MRVTYVGNDWRRQFLVDHSGPPWTCCLCGEPITYKGGTKADALAIRHVNGVSDDHRPGNLAPAHQGCNRSAYGQRPRTEPEKAAMRLAARNRSSERKAQVTATLLARMAEKSPDELSERARKGRAGMSAEAKTEAARKNARKTHCPKGHPYDEANTYVRSNGWRQCRACIRGRAGARSRR